MLKTAAEQLLDHPLVSFLEEAGLEFVGMCSGDMDKSSAPVRPEEVDEYIRKYDKDRAAAGYSPMRGAEKEEFRRHTKNEWKGSVDGKRQKSLFDIKVVNIPAAPRRTI